MKLTNEQFTEAAFIFEQENGNCHSNYEKEIISESKLTEFEPTELQQIIVDGLNSRIYENEFDRVSAYWALSKIGNHNLISDFQKWLKMELEYGNGISIFQILVALDRLDEPAFSEKRTGRAADETELNIKDAKHYLNNCFQNNL